MYDDWGNEIMISPMAYPPLDDGLALDARTWAALYPSDVSSDESWTVGPANEAPILPLSDDPFLIPSTDGPAPFKAKPGSDGDWLTPLFNDEADLGEIVVPGTRPPTPGEYYDGHGDNWSPSHDTDYRGDSSGDPPPEDQHDACQDRESDALADDINDEISRQPDSEEREYGALIWRDDAGNLHRTRLLAGDNFRLTELATVNLQTLGINAWSQVVGIVHSHPTMIDTGTEANPTGIYTPAASTERYDLMSGGDHFTADQIVGYGASRNNFTSYISYNGNVREFDYSDNVNESRTNNTGGRGVESNDYEPEAECQ